MNLNIYKEPPCLYFGDMEKENTTTSYLSLEAVALTLNLPRSFLRTLAADRKIPYLDVKGRLRFNPKAVQDALDHQAKIGSQQFEQQRREIESLEKELAEAREEIKRLKELLMTKQELTAKLKDIQTENLSIDDNGDTIRTEYK